YTAATFTVASDGHGGSAITVTGAARVLPPSAGHFVAQMASLGGEGAANHPPVPHPLTALLTHLAPPSLP
ncbi:MAG: hypothetical protein ABI306_03775, partial [Caulobacteraceae bacterium]